VAASEAHTVTAKNLAMTDDNYHTAQPALVCTYVFNFTSDITLGGGDVEPCVLSPRHTRVFLGPLSPDIIWLRNSQAMTPGSGQVLGTAQVQAVYNTAGPVGAEDWFDQPGPPGVPVFPSALLQADSARIPDFALCSGCRMGNDFIPWMYLTSPDPLTPPAATRLRSPPSTWVPAPPRSRA
jgi:hypothetical protein